MTTQEFVIESVIGKAREDANHTRQQNSRVGEPVPQMVNMYVDLSYGNAGVITFRNDRTWSTILYLTFYFINDEVKINLFKRTDQLDGRERLTRANLSWQFYSTSDHAGPHFKDIYNEVLKHLTNKEIESL